MMHTTLSRRFRLARSILFSIAGLALATSVVAQEKAPKEGESALVVTGCLKGRVLTVTGNPNEDGQVVRQDVLGRSFRLSGKKDVMNVVKEHNGHLVEARGVVRSSDLATPQGFKIGGTNVKVGVTPVDPTRSGPAMTQDPLMNVIVMDVSSVSFISESCPIWKR